MSKYNQQHSPSLLLDALYCQEQHQEESYYTHSINPKPTVFLEQDLLWEEEELSALLSKEQENEMCKNLKNNPSLAEARREAVEWMLKAIAHYSFSALTAFLAVNYFDRFLHTFQFQREKPWMIQLTSVACLSLAAKVEETRVPLLLDLQVEEAKYVFEAKTIQRMEILVLSNLQWKMNPVTPLSFLDYITRRLGLKDHLCWEFIKRCEFLLFSIVSDCRFMHYLPSVIASATMLHVINGVEPCLGAEYQTQLLCILGIHKDKVEDCCKLIQDLASRIQFHSTKKRSFGSLPGSPNGVMDASFSSDSSNDSWAVVSASSSSPEPLSKKNRAQHSLLDLP